MIDFIFLNEIFLINGTSLKQASPVEIGFPGLRVRPRGLQMDSNTSIEQLKDLIKNFCHERDWDQFHTAKDLAIGLVTEASEVLEHFRFQSESDVKELLESPSRKEQIEDELADTLFFILRFGQRYNIDLATATARKLNKNALKYPVDKCRGLNKKYTELN